MLASSTHGGVVCHQLLAAQTHVPEAILAHVVVPEASAAVVAYPAGASSDAHSLSGRHPTFEAVRVRIAFGTLVLAVLIQ